MGPKHLPMVENLLLTAHNIYMLSPIVNDWFLMVVFYHIYIITLFIEHNFTINFHLFTILSFLFLPLLLITLSSQPSRYYYYF